MMKTKYGPKPGVTSYLFRLNKLDRRKGDGNTVEFVRVSDYNELLEAERITREALVTIAFSATSDGRRLADEACLTLDRLALVAEKRSKR